MNLLRLLVFCICLYGVLARHEIYDGHAVYDVNIKNESDAKVFSELEDKLNLDVWSHAMPGHNHHAKVLVSKVNKKEFEKALKNANVKYKIDVKNIKVYLDLEDKLLADGIERAGSYYPRPSISFKTIHKYSGVNKYLDYLAKSYRLVDVGNAGRSFEGRIIKFIRISDSNFRNASKPIIYMQSLLHAREWISLPVTLYTIHKLVMDQHLTHVDLIRDFDWIILPIANPDGYEWTHQEDRFWRKNRANDYHHQSCLGVDLNRNFGHYWAKIAPIDDVCKEHFHGRGSFSEPESYAIMKILAQYRKRIVLFLDIHSFGSKILYPYGNGLYPRDPGLHWAVGAKMAEAIDKVKLSLNKKYTIGNIANILYGCSGLAMDYASAIGVPLSYTVLMPSYSKAKFDTNKSFLVDPKFIEQAGSETWEAIKVAARAAKSLKNTKP